MTSHDSAVLYECICSSSIWWCSSLHTKPALLLSSGHLAGRRLKRKLTKIVGRQKGVGGFQALFAEPTSTLHEAH